MTDQEIILKREIGRLQEQVRLLTLRNQQLELKVEKMKACANCTQLYDKIISENYGITQGKCKDCKQYSEWELKV